MKLIYPPTQKTPALAGDECVGRTLRSPAVKDRAKKSLAARLCEATASLRRSRASADSADPPAGEAGKLGTLGYARGGLHFAWVLLVLSFAALTPPVFSEDKSPQNHSASISSEDFLSSQFAAEFKQHQYSKALEALEDLAKKYPEDPLITRYRALTLEKLGRLSEATQAYQKLLAKDPGQVTARIFLGKAYVPSGFFPPEMAT